MDEPISRPRPIEGAEREPGQPGGRTPATLDYQVLFEKSPDILLVLLPDAPRYTMVAATDARLNATHTTRESLGRGLFEVFPDNPDDSGATGTSNLRASLERVRSTRRPDTMPVQKYDIRGPDGKFESRHWSPKNLPVLSPCGELLYILHRVEDVTELVRANELGDELRGQTHQMEREVLKRSHELAAALRELREANAELAQQRRARETELERRVEERTAELAATAQRLARENERREATERRLEAQLQRMGTLDHITRAVAERQDLRSILQVVVANVEQSLPAEACWVGLAGPETQALPIGGELRYEPDLERCPVALPPRLAERGLRSLVTAPLRVDADVLGALVAGRREAGGFDEADCEFLRQLSEHVALAVRQGQLRESLQAAYDDLSRSQQSALQRERLSALGQMASGIAHDINNAISPPTLYLETLLRSDVSLSEQARQYLQLVLRSMEDVAATVARMREFYRQRESEQAFAPVDLNVLVGQTLELTRARWSDMPQQRGIVISASTDLSPRLPPAAAVESEIREALTNLVFNAVDAMPQGGTLLIRTGAQGPLPFVEVADTGLGMDEDTRRRCLEPFFTTKGERGTGLGLAMVYGAVQRHSADIHIDSAPGAGTRIRITFPVSKADSGVPRDEASAFVCPPLRILLIDDDPLVLKSLKDALEAEGHTITAANDSRAGVEDFRAALASDPFAVVVTDLGMPHLDGRGVARAVKEASPATPVILLTGWGQSQEAGGGLPPGVDRVLGKPPKLRELRETLSWCVSRPR